MLPCAWHKPDTVKVDYKIGFVFDPRKLTSCRSPDETDADTLDSQPGMDGLLADLPEPMSLSRLCDV